MAYCTTSEPKSVIACPEMNSAAFFFQFLCI
jgi:hypothetical protein